MFWFLFPTPEHDKNRTATPERGEGARRNLRARPEVTVVHQVGGDDIKMSLRVLEPAGDRYFFPSTPPENQTIAPVPHMGNDSSGSVFHTKVVFINLQHTRASPRYIGPTH